MADVVTGVLKCCEAPGVSGEVINVAAGGRISPRRGPGPQIQRRRLTAEGVRFRAGRVDMARHGLDG